MASTTRRMVLTTLLSGMAAGLAGCSSSCPDSGTPSSAYTVPTDDVGSGYDTLPAGSWTSPRSDSANTGYTAHASVSDTPTIQWQTTVPVPTTGDVTAATSPPVVAADTVFIATSAGVFALALRDGTERWRRDIEPVVHTETGPYGQRPVAPIVVDEHLICATDAGVVALDIADGSTLWKTAANMNTGVPTSTDAGILVPTADGVLMLSSDDGTKQWSAATAAVMPAVVNDTVVTGGAQPTALDALTGEKRWVRSDQQSSYPVITDETVYFGTSDGLAARSLADGSNTWLIDRGRFMEPPVVTPQSIYAVERPGEAGHATFAFDRGDREAPAPRWCSEVGDGIVLAATNETALIHRADGLFGFSSDLGEVTWKHPLGTQPTAPALLDGGLVTTTDTGTVTALGGR